MVEHANIQANRREINTSVLCITNNFRLISMCQVDCANAPALRRLYATILSKHAHFCILICHALLHIALGSVWTNCFGVFANSEKWL